MDAKEFMESLDNVYCRLMASKYGVGVFAIRKIPEGANPFVGCFDGEFVEIPERDVMNLQDPFIKQYIIDIAPLQEGHFYVPECGLQRMDVSFFLNHSKTPNMREEGEEFYFFAIRDIEIGEELTVDYTTYDDYVKKDPDIKDK
jgi:SET domain-containing protein